MKQENITRILNGIDPTFLEECCLPPERNAMKKYSARRLAVLVAAACLLLCALITGYATGAFDSLIGKFWGSIQYADPEEERAKGRDDYADWLETELETQAVMLEISAKMQPENQFFPIAEGSSYGVTLLESYYDGEKCALGGKITLADEGIHFDVDETKLDKSAMEHLGDLETSALAEQVSPEEYAAILEQLKSRGSVAFRMEDAWLRDHVYAGGEDMGCCHSDVDPDGYFIIDPYVMGIGEISLPDSCIDQPEITITVNYTLQQEIYYLEGDAVYYLRQMESFPVDMTISRTQIPEES